jgi:hypothetical protein
MNRIGPVVTLIAGFVTASVLVGLSMNATAQEDAVKQDNANAAAGNQDKPADKPADKPQAAKPQNALDKIEASYAGRVNGGDATVAIAVKKGQAVAYLCDGSEIEAWMKGTVTDGTLKLTGAKGARLDGKYSETAANGSVTAAGKQWQFTAAVAKAPSGLYRATAQVRNADIIGGWIVLQNGQQVGVVTSDGVPAAAPPLNTSDGSATVDGQQVNADAVDGETDL